MEDKVLLYAPIEKTDEEQRMVYGYASTEAVDSQGEIVKKEALKKALEDYMKYANIREMHQPSAVGKTKKAQIDSKGLYVAVKVVDDKAWEKVKEGVYNGFSIGGRVRQMVDNEITDLTLAEISLVDRPANPEALFDVYKADMPTTEKRDYSAEERKTMAENGEALPDGSYPIKNETDLKNAIQAFGRAKNKKKVKRHITARAKDLGLTNLLPEDWAGSTKEKSETVEMEKSNYFLGEMASPAECVARIVAYNASLQIAHWKANTVTNEHKALGDLYEAMVEIVDEFTEVFMGKYGVPEFPQMSLMVDITAEPVAIGLKLVENMQSHFVPGADDDLLNLLADMTAALNKAAYLLKEPVAEPVVEPKAEVAPEALTEVANAGVVMQADLEMTIEKKVEAELAALRMPTDEMIVELLKSQDMEVDDKTIGVAKYQFADVIIKTVSDSMARQAELDLAKKEAEEAQKETPVVTGNYKEIINLIEKMEDEVKKSTVSEVAMPETAPVSPEAANEVESAELKMRQRVVELLSMMNSGNALTPDEEKELRDGIKALSEMTSRMDKEPGTVEDLQPKKEVSDMDMNLSKYEGEINELKAQLQKFMAEPAPIKVKSAYTVDRFELSNDSGHLAKAEKRAEEIVALMKANPTDRALIAEAAELSSTIMRLKRQ